MQEELKQWDEAHLPMRMETLIYAAKKWVAVREAITNEGPEPRLHRKIMKRHAREWPTLWKILLDEEN